MKIATLATLAALCGNAYAYEIPNWVQPIGSKASTAPNYHVNHMNPPATCENKPEVEAWLKAWRQAERQGYAEWVAKNIPQVGKTKCIRSKAAFDVKHEPNGDYFVVTCLAQTNGTLTHLFKMELLAEPAECLSDKRFSDFVNSPLCSGPGDVHRFLNLVMKPCPRGPVPPQLRAANISYPIDPAFFADLLNKWPSFQSIVENDRRVKIGVSSPGGTVKEGDCNASGCWPGSSNSRDVK